MTAVVLKFRSPRNNQLRLVRLKSVGHIRLVCKPRMLTKILEQIAAEKLGRVR